MEFLGFSIELGHPDIVTIVAKHELKEPDLLVAGHQIFQTYRLSGFSPETSLLVDLFQFGVSHYHGLIIWIDRLALTRGCFIF